MSVASCVPRASALCAAGSLVDAHVLTAACLFSRRYGRQLYKHPTGLAPGEFAVNPNLDFEALQDAYFAHESIVSVRRLFCSVALSMRVRVRPCIHEVCCSSSLCALPSAQFELVWCGQVDNLLTPKALDQLRSFLLVRAMIIGVCVSRLMSVGSLQYSSIWNTPKRGACFLHPLSLRRFPRLPVTDCRSFMMASWLPSMYSNVQAGTSGPSCTTGSPRRCWRRSPKSCERGKPKALKPNPWLSPVTRLASVACLGLFADPACWLAHAHRFPRIFCQHKLYTSWAFLYDDELSEGIGVHADNGRPCLSIALRLASHSGPSDGLHGAVCVGWVQRR